MKKRFTFLIAALMLLIFMMPTMAGWGQTRDTKTDIMFAKGFAGYNTNSYSAAGTDRKAVANSTNTTGVTYAMQVFNGNQGTVRGNQSGAANYSCRNTTTYNDYYISSVTLTITGGTLKNSNGRSLVYFGSSAYANPNTTAPTGTSTTASLSSNSKTLTWTNTDENVSYFILYNLETSGNCYSANADSPLTVVWTSKTPASSVATPQLSKGTSYCDEDQSITITCDTEDATIYYTLDDTEPTSSSTPYTEAISITETTKLRAIAIKGSDSSAEASATYTFVTTLKTMDAIYNAATNTTETVYIHFNNFLISAINSGSPSTVAYLTDGVKGCYINVSGHGFTAGKVLNGIVSCTLKKQYEMAWITGLTASSEGLMVTDGGTITPVVSTINGLGGTNAGSLVTIKDLTWNSSETTFSDGTYTIKLSNAISNQSSLLTNGNKYDITGVFDYNSSSEKRINPRNAADVVPGPATLPFEWTGGGKNALMALQGVTANGLGNDYSSLTHGNYIVRMDDTDDYIMVKTDSQPDVVTIGVKMIGGNSSSTITVQGSTDGVNFDTGENLTISGTSNDIVELTSTRTFGADVRYVKLYYTKGSNIGVGPISITKYIEKYNISLSSPTTGGSFTADKATAAAGETVTLTPVPEPHYVFDSWTVCKTGDPSTIVTVNNNQFEMPAYAVTVSATFTELPVRTITIPNNIASNVAVDVTEAYAGDEVTITVVAPEDEFLTSLTVTGNTTSNPITLSPEVSSSEDTYTFIMPDENVTISATFAGEYTVQFSVNGTSTGSPTVTSGDVTLPSQIDVPDGFDFPGWTTDPTNFNNIITGSSYTPTADVTLYAVFSRTITGPTVTTYNKVSSISEGYYLIVCENSNVAFDGSLGTLDAVGNTISVNIENNTIASSASTDGAVFTISAVQGGYSIQSASEYYIGQTTDANGLQSSAETVYTNSISFNDGNADIVSSGGAYLRYNSASNQTRFRYYKSSTYASQGAIQLYKKETTAPSTTEYYTRVFPSNTTATANITIECPTVIESGVVLDMGEFTLTCNNPANLVIKDGAQLKVYTTGAKDGGVQATVEKNISGYGGDNTVKTGWNFIASPIDVNNLAPTAVTNMLTNTYDLYQLNNTKWENYKQSGDHYHFNLTNGRGYLYANSADVTLSFAGAIKPFTTTGGANEVALADGWNLVGNPYTFNVYSSKSYYTITTENGENVITAVTSASDYIAPCTGIVVKSTGASSVAFTEEAATSWATGNQGNIQMTLAQQASNRGNATTIDNAIVSFNEGSQLEKFYFGNPSASIFIPQNGEDYAIAFSDRQGDVPLYFKANETDTYTISFAGDEMSLNGIYLIDILAEEEIDLSVNPSYTFIGSPADRMARFKIVFRNTGGDGTSDIFAYQNGNDIVVTGEGELQIFDVMGRMVSRQRVNGVETVNVKSQGVYIFRLNDKTQKIVVR